MDVGQEDLVDVDQPPQIPTDDEDRAAFIHTALRFRAGQASLEAFIEVFYTIAVHGQRHDQQTKLLVFDGPDGGRWTSVFTSMATLARHVQARGELDNGLTYWSTTGADLLDELLPPGVGLLVDPGQDHAVGLPAAWLTSPGSDPAHTPSE